jgi:hypothetical protein
MYKVNIVYICQMDFNNARSYREIICSGKPEFFFFLQIGRLLGHNWPAGQQITIRPMSASL